MQWNTSNIWNIVSNLFKFIVRYSQYQVILSNACRYWLDMAMLLDAGILCGVLGFQTIEEEKPLNPLCDPTILINSNKTHVMPKSLIFDHLYKFFCTETKFHVTGNRLSNAPCQKLTFHEQLCQ